MTASAYARRTPRAGAQALEAVEAIGEQPMAAPDVHAEPAELATEQTFAKGEAISGTVTKATRCTS